MGRSTLFVLLLALPGLLHAAAEPPLPYHLDIFGSTDPIESFTVGDCDGDGWDEFVAWGIPQNGTTDVLQVWDFDRGRFRVVWHWNVQDGSVTDCHVSDLEETEGPEIVVSRFDGERAWLETYKVGVGGRVRSSIPVKLPDTDGKDGWDGKFLIETCADIDLDGTNDIICSCGAGYDLSPRGITVYSGKTMEEISSFPTAGPVNRAAVSVGSDGLARHILVGTEAVGNGRVIGPFNDSEMYFCVLDLDCNLLWYTRTAAKGGCWCFAVEDFDSDGEPDVIVSTEWDKGTEAKGHRLEIRAIDTGDIKKYRSLATNMYSIIPVDTDRDTKPEMALSLVDGTVQVLDAALAPLKSYSGEAPVYLEVVGDIDLDGEIEIVGRSGNASAIILDTDLNLIARRDFGSLVRRIALGVSGESNPFLHVLVGNGRELKNLKLRRASLFPAGPRGIGVFPTLLIALAALAVGAALGVLMVRSRRIAEAAKEPPLSSTLAGRQLLTALSAFGHSGLAGRNLERLAQYSESASQPGDERYSEYRQRLSSIIVTYNDSTIRQMEEIAALCRDVAECRQFASRLSSKVEALTRAVRGESAEDGAGAVSRGARAILDDLRTLRRTLLSSYRTDACAVACRVVSALREQTMELGVTEMSVSAGGDAIAQVDEEALKSALEVVLVNGAEAMESADSPALRVEVDTVGHHVVVRVRDTGRGVPKEDWERIFKRGVTTKGQDRGLGLYHAYQVLSLYGATIGIESSSPETGTVMAIQLRAVERPNPAKIDSPRSVRTEV